MRNFKLASLALISVLSFNSCKDDDDAPEPIHDHEGIHELVIQRTNLDGSNPVTYEFVAGEAVGETITLSHNTDYDFEIIALNAHEEEGEHNIIDEMVEAVEEHFFLYEKAETLDISLVRTDEPATTRNDGTKIGVKTRISANEMSNGILQIELKHQPSAVDDAANDGFGSSTGGATDVLALFPVVVE